MFSKRLDNYGFICHNLYMSDKDSPAPHNADVLGPGQSMVAGNFSPAVREAFERIQAALFPDRPTPEVLRIKEEKDGH